MNAGYLNTITNTVTNESTATPHYGYERVITCRIMLWQIDQHSHSGGDRCIDAGVVGMIVGTGLESILQKMEKGCLVGAALVED